MKVSFTTLQSLFLLSFSFANKREEVFTKTTLFCDQHSAPLTWWKGMFGRTVALSSDNTALVHHAVFVTLARTGRWFDHRLSFRITPLKNSSDLTQAHAVDTHTHSHARTDHTFLEGAVHSATENSGNIVAVSQTEGCILRRSHL